jgi:hypothetical protein
MQYKPTGEEELIHGLFGGAITKPRRHFCYKIRLQSLDNKYACNLKLRHPRCVRYKKMVQVVESKTHLIIKYSTTLLVVFLTVLPAPS